MTFSRSSGILMPIFSLPSPYGTGTLGREARSFVDFLQQAGQRYWQVLPVGPVSYGDSPYQSFSSFAGNPYFVDLDMLVEDGLLTQAEVDAPDWGSDPERVDYGCLYQARFTLLQKAAERGFVRYADALEAFVRENTAWLPDYALFMAVKRHFNMSPWGEWPDEDIRLHRPEACAAYAEKLAQDVRLFEFIQFLFYRQWDALKAYADSRGICIIGDIPIYVAMDSADVWAEPGCFQLNERNVPTEVAGVPPDAFSEEGQLWGNPLYRWDEMEKDGFRWWVRRIRGAFRLFDVLRLDHFRGLESYWKVPFGAESAKEGCWVKGPGEKLVAAIRESFPDRPIIAEDLGYLTQDVRDLLAFSGFPGMRLLEMAFELGGNPYYMPHSYPNSCVCYVGTHDNNTALGWLEDADPETVQMAHRYLGLNDEEGKGWGMIRGGMSSCADLFVMQMQDCLQLGTEARVNAPGTHSGNWGWRMKAGAASPELAHKLNSLCRLYGRA